MRLSPTAALLSLSILSLPWSAAAQERGSAPRAVSIGESSSTGMGAVAESPAADDAVLAFPTVTYQRTTKAVPSSLCDSVPTAATSFASSDASVYLYFRISGYQNGEGLYFVWWDPSGQVYHRGDWSPLSTQYTSYCMEAHMSLAGTAAASKPGTWRVQVYSDKITDVPYVDLTFTVTSSGSGGFPTITNARTAKSVPQGACTPLPTPETSFSPTDSRVYVFFNITGHANGETLTRVWYTPSGEIFASGSWSPLSSGTGYCPSASLGIAGTSVASTPGTWRVKVFSDKITDVPYLDLQFTISTSGGSGGLPTVTYARTTKSVPANYACTPLPTSTTSFSSTDARVYLFFQISGHSDGERLSRVWYSPDGNVFATGQWDPLPAGGSICRWASLEIAGASAATKPGTWRVQVFSDQIFDVPYVDQTFTISSGGGGGGTVAGTWILTSSARVQGAGAFWQTDLSIRNTGTSSANVTMKFLGHSGDGRGGPERYATILAGQTQTWRDILGGLFGLSSEYGPILVRSTSASLAILGQTWTAGGAGTYGQSVPVLATGELIGATPRSILGVRQDTFFRTNLMLANATESTASVTIQLVSTGGTVLATKTVSIGPLSRAQYNVGTDFGYTNLSDAVFVISSPTAGAAVGAYASVIDSGTADPRTLLPR